MKNLMVLCCLLLFLNCKEKEQKETSVLKQTVIKTKNGAIELIIDSKTYVYDNIDWEKSGIKNDGDIRLSIRQGDLPKIIFKFPDIEKSLTDGQDTFEIPDVHRKGFSPITLNFIMNKEEEGKKQEAVSFRKGKIKVSFKNNQLKMEFEGEGGPTLDDSKIYPISGTVNINI